MARPARDFATLLAARIRKLAKNNERGAARRALGVCVQCAKPRRPIVGDSSMCATCRRRHRANRRAAQRS